MDDSLKYFSNIREKTDGAVGGGHDGVFALFREEDNKSFFPHTGKWVCLRQSLKIWVRFSIHLRGRFFSILLDTLSAPGALRIFSRRIMCLTSSVVVGSRFWSGSQFLSHFATSFSMCSSKSSSTSSEFSRNCPSRESAKASALSSSVKTNPFRHGWVSRSQGLF